MTFVSLVWQGFDIDVYPGNAKAAIYVPYLDFETEIDMLTELANHAIEEFNKSSSVCLCASFLYLNTLSISWDGLCEWYWFSLQAYKYKFLYIEKVNYIMTKYREYFITVKVANLTLRTPMATFQIRAYKGPNAENIISLCRRKGEDVKAVNEVYLSHFFSYCWNGSF